MSKTLQMSLKSKWFEMTKKGIKTEDYREISDYWMKRFLTNESFSEYIDAKNSGGNEFENGTFNISFAYFKKFNTNKMTLGYPKSTDSERIIELDHKGIEIGYGKTEWGAEEGKLYFIIKHGKLLTKY